MVEDWLLADRRTLVVWSKEVALWKDPLGRSEGLGTSAAADSLTISILWRRCFFEEEEKLCQPGFYWIWNFIFVRMRNIQLSIFWFQSIEAATNMHYITNIKISWLGMEYFCISSFLSIPFYIDYWFLSNKKRNVFLNNLNYNFITNNLLITVH